MTELVLDVWRYVQQILPLGLLALLVFFLMRPWRKRQLQRLGLTSTPVREIALGLFILFCAGLAALTLFPSNFWLFVSTLGRTYPQGTTLWSFYPTWEQTMANLEFLPASLVPFHQIGRDLADPSYWGLFMLLGNIVLFAPIGFFSALLWRDVRWWKAGIIGLGSSCIIELLQLFIDRGTDIDDVILNTTGALLGYGAFWVLNRCFPAFLGQFQCQIMEEL